MKNRQKDKEVIYNFENDSLVKIVEENSKRYGNQSDVCCSSHIPYGYRQKFIQDSNPKRERGMDKESIIIDSSNSCIGAVIYIDSEKWEDGKERYRWDIVEQKNGKIINTISVHYASCIGQAVANAVYKIKKGRKIKK